MELQILLNKADHFERSTDRYRQPLHTTPYSSLPFDTFAKLRMVDEQTEGNLKVLIKIYDDVIELMKPTEEGLIFLRRGMAYLDLSRKYKKWADGAAHLTKAITLGNLTNSMGPLEGLRNVEMRMLPVVLAVAKERSGRLEEDVVELQQACKLDTFPMKNKDINKFIGEIKFIDLVKLNQNHGSRILHKLRKNIIVDPSSIEGERKLLQNLLDPHPHRMVKVPECLRCPLSRGIFRDPYATSYCKTYEKFVVFKHFGRSVVNGRYTDPDTEKDITFMRR